MKPKADYCQYCWPTRKKSHLDRQINYYLNRFTGIDRFDSNLNSNLWWLNRYVWGSILQLGNLIRVIEFESNPDRQQLYNRSLIFWDEARRRKIPIAAIKVFGRYVHEFQFIYRNKKYHYSGVPLTIRPNKLDLDNKYLIKKTLSEFGIPVPKGEIFHNFQSGFNYGQQLGYPLVVKPNSGSLSHHVSYPINSDEQLKTAIKVAQLYQPDFIVEQYITGNFYRATIIGQKTVFVCQKDPSNVVGDGKATIEQLIKSKNSHQLRGEQRQRNTTLHKIVVDQVLQKKLVSQNLKLTSVLRKGQKVYLQDKYILALGCDIINYSQKTHPNNLKLFRKVAQVLNTDFVGIDFLAPDITKSYQSQITGIIETNSLPYLDMHQYPSEGRGDDVAKIVWDWVLKQLA